jgi:putative restriction endonuclease
MSSSIQPRRNWTQKELIAAFNLYCKITFGSIHHRNPKIIQLSELIKRTPSAVSFKLSNFASFDPELKARGIRGMKNASKKDADIFEQFYNDREKLAFESEIVLAEFEEKTIEEKLYHQLPELDNFIGEEKERYVKTRVNQHFFREMILANYDGKCAITGIDIPQMIYASHIIPWSKNKEQRLNPANGICLSAHFDSAFDKGLISFDSDYKLILNSRFNEMQHKPFYNNWFKQFEGSKLQLPFKAKPGLEFLEWHRKELLNQ